MIDSAPQQSTTFTAPPAAPESGGYDTRQQLFRELIKDGELLLKNRLEVRHLMTRELVVIPPTMVVEDITALMQERRLHHLLVCGRGGELLGVISDRDLRSSRGATAQQLMSFPVLTVSPETLLSPAITYLMSEGISCLPVVKDGRLCGVLTTTDLVLTLQCTLQLWQRLAQVIQHDSTWEKALERIAALLTGPLTAKQLADRLAEARQAIRRQVDDLLNVTDLRADVLTGMSNRRGLEEMLDLLLAMKRRHNQPLSVVVVTIDHYERISEKCGESVARTLLRAVARLVEQSVRASDFVARCRDDALAIVLTQTGSESADDFCRRLREAAQRDADLEIELRISIGVAAPEPDEDAAQLLRRAEAAVA